MAVGADCGSVVVCVFLDVFGGVDGEASIATDCLTGFDLFFISHGNHGGGCYFNGGHYCTSL